MREKIVNEEQVTGLYFANKISLEEHHNLIRKIAGKRHRVQIDQKKDKKSMSSTKWS